MIDGNRRLAGAMQAGRAEVPCYLDPEAAADKASQFLDMVVGNGAGYRRNFTPVEEATALFAASQAGATRTRIRKVTGRSAAQVKTALAAGGLSSQTREAAGHMAAQLDLDQLALLAEFDGDPAAVDRIVGAMRIGYSAEHEAERIRQQRAEAAEHDRLVAELEAAGVVVTDSLPEGAIPLRGLLHDGDDLIPENHVSCPGRGAYFLSVEPARAGALLRQPGRERSRRAGLRAARRRWQRGQHLVRLSRRWPAGGPGPGAGSEPQAGDRGQQGVEGRWRGAEAVAGHAPVRAPCRAP